MSTVRTRIARGMGLVPLVLILLASIEPFLGFLDRNRDEYVQSWILIQLGVATVAAMMVVYVVLLMVLPRVEPARIAAALAVFVFCFFRYRSVVGALDDRMSVRLVGWLVFTAVVVASVALWSRYENLRLFILLFLLIMTFMPAVSYTGYVLGKRPVDGQAQSELPPVNTAKQAERTPNVWWLMLDEYARGDVLQELYGFDNSAFFDDLTDRQFTIAEDSYSSYPVTALSVSSVLDLNYTVTDPSELGDGIHTAAMSLRGKGRVARALESHGYRYMFAESGAFDWAKCDRAVVDVCIEPDRTGLPVEDLIRQVASMTPLAEVRSGVRPDPVSTVRRTKERMAAGEPTFIFAHVLNPHYPLWYNEECQFASSPDRDLNFFEVSYIHQIECLNPQVIEAVDLILDDDPDAMVIVQSDHGGKLLTDWGKPYDRWTADELAERYAILEAMRFPDGCAAPSGVHSNVSTFEYVLACIEGRAPEPLEDRYFMWRYGAPTELLEIERPRAINAD